MSLMDFIHHLFAVMLGCIWIASYFGETGE